MKAGRSIEAAGGDEVTSPAHGGEVIGRDQREPSFLVVRSPQPLRARASRPPGCAFDRALHTVNRAPNPAVAFYEHAT
jgi:hypothetical protein